jgi:hypothetical protein
LQTRYLTIDTAPVAGVVGIKINADGQTTRSARHDRINVFQSGNVAVVIGGGEVLVHLRINSGSRFLAKITVKS